MNTPTDVPVVDIWNLRGDGVRCEAGPGFVQAGGADSATVTLVVDFACPSGFRALEVRDDIFDLLGPEHHTLMKVEWADQTRQVALEPGSRDARFSAGAPVTENTTSFVLLGVEHILSGYDHLLFLVALLLSGGTLLALLKIVTAFTVAHSVTLSLAVLDLVALPDRLVEAVIALSIAFVAAENLAPRPAVGRRWLVSFAFGLVHGFGFSSALRELGLGRENLVVSLLSFNVGVELGQALVIAALLPLLALLRRTRWKSWAIAGSSAAILAVGVILFVERLVL